MLKKLKLYVMLYLETRNFERAISNSHFSDLKFAPSAIEGLLSESRELHPSITRLWQRKLTDALVNKALLLATGIDDIISLSNGIKLPAIRNALFKAYGARTGDLGNIITLLNNLNKGVNYDTLDFEEANECYSTGALLTTYGRKLAAETGPSLSIGSIGLLAERIENFTRNQDDSRAAEDLVIGLAVAKLKGDPHGAVHFAEHFQLIPSHHRFLSAWLDENQLTSSIQAMRFADAIVTHKLGGSHVASQILRRISEAGIDLGHGLRSKLEKLANPDSGSRDGSIGDLIGRLISTVALHNILERAFDNVFGELEDQPGLSDIIPGFEDGDDFPGFDGPLPSIFSPMNADDGEYRGLDITGCFECAKLPSCPAKKASRAREALGMSPTKTDSSWGSAMIEITEGTEEERIRQLEEHIIKHCEEGTLDMVIINNMPAELFAMMNLEIFTPEGGERIKSAIMAS